MSENFPLLYLHRNFSENEAVKLALDEIAKRDFRIGELLSEIAELQYKIEELTKKPPISVDPNKKTAKQWNREEYVQEVTKQAKTEVSALQKHLKESNDNVIFWRNKWADLNAKYEKLTKS